MEMDFQLFRLKAQCFRIKCSSAALEISSHSAYSRPYLRAVIDPPGSWYRDCLSMMQQFRAIRSDNTMWGRVRGNPTLICKCDSHSRAISQKWPHIHWKLVWSAKRRVIFRAAHARLGSGLRLTIRREEINRISEMRAQDEHSRFYA